MMSHLLTTTISCLSSNHTQRLHQLHPPPTHHDALHHNRRSLSFSLTSGLILGLTIGDKSAEAARRPPPPPPAEKKDPNVTGVLAKVLASKKRKEEMKAAVAKLRERGKKVDE